VFTHSVTGPLPSDGLGQVLTHEHLLIDYGQMGGAATPVTAEILAQCRSVLVALREIGVGTVVDCTPPGYGRDLALLAELSRTTGVRLVASTGSFCEQWHPQPADVSAAPADVLAERFVRELEEGGCGVIKVATSHDAITANEEKLLVAAAAAHRTTGAPIVSHTTDGMGLEQLALYLSEGVALDAVLVSHVCSGSEPFDYALELAAKGAVLGLDRVGHAGHDLDHWVSLILELRRAGLLRQVTLSHDSVQRFVGPAQIAGHTFSDPTVVTTQLVPLLQRAGLSAEETGLMTHDNPRRWLLREGGAR
jgi:predicted metal-dependent phosphotriesterase family hydrolase